jgi:hypothetical protein
MFLFAFEISGLPALLLILLIIYIFIYLPLKFAMILISRAKQKAGKLHALHHNTIIAEYDPPSGLAPAELGFLYDTKIEPDELYATVVSLQQKDLVNINELNGQFVIGATQPPTAALKDFEKFTLNFLSRHQGQVITRNLLGKLNPKLKFVKAGEDFNPQELITINAIIKKGLETDGYLVSASEQIKKSLLRMGIIGLGLYILTFLIFRPHTLANIEAFLFFMALAWPVYFFVAIGLYIGSAKVAGQPWLGTPKLKQIWPEIEGYREFIKQVELDTIKYDSDDKKGLIKNKTAPYAIPLGFNTGWQNKIK